MNDLEKAGQRTAFVLFISQSLFSASSIIGFTVGSIIVVQLADGNSRWTGVPSTLALVGAALVVYPMGRLMDRAVRVVACEREETRVSTASVLKSAGVSTVDNADSELGHIALVYTLSGLQGNFGVKPTADRLLPDLMAAPTP